MSYFFITDQLLKKELELTYCPTLFRDVQRKVMNIKDDSEINNLTCHRSVLDKKLDKVIPVTDQGVQCDV